MQIKRKLSPEKWNLQPLGSRGKSVGLSFPKIKENEYGLERKKIKTLGMVSKNRPEAVKRGLKSYILNCKAYGHTNDYVLMDDSDDPKICRENRNVLRLLQKSYGVKILYGGLEQKNRFAKLLIRTSGIQDSIINFMLFGSSNVGATVGANRNAFLLHTLGDKVFLTDDDTICKFAEIPEIKSGLTLSAHRDLYQQWLFSNQEEAFNFVNFIEEDLLSLHEQFLGHEFEDIISAYRNMGDFHLDSEHINSNFKQRIKTGGKVLVTMNGLIGDCAMYTPFGQWDMPYGVLLLGKKSHKRLVKSKASYQLGCTTRETLQGVDQVTLSDRAYFKTTFFGLDNRNLLPPQLPVFIGSDDILWGMVLERCRSDCFFCHFPWALMHSPLTRRRHYWPGEILRGASGFEMIKLIINCVNCFEFESGKKSVEERMASLGVHLMELAALPFEDFEDVVRMQAINANNSFIDTIEKRLHFYDNLPPYWAADLEKYVEVLRREMRKRDYIIPLELRLKFGLDESKYLMQKIIGMYGKLLFWWPQIIVAVRNLKTQGERLAQPI